MRLRRLAGLIVLVIVLALATGACSQDVDTTPEQRVCIAQHFTNYDARQLNQCLEVCKLCMRGSAVTCHTSCRLRGAS